MCQLPNCTHAVVLHATVADPKRSANSDRVLATGGVATPKVSNFQVDNNFNTTPATVNRHYQVKLPWKYKEELLDNHVVAEI